MRRLLCCALMPMFLIGCSQELDGPEPRMDHGPEDLATTPSFVCNEAHPDDGTWVTVDGEAFSPLVVDAIASEDDPDVELPVVALELRKTPTGEEVEAGERIDLKSPLGMDAGDVRWLDENTLQFRVTDDLELDPGVYDVEVENPNGQLAVEQDAFGVLPRPELHTAVPELTCVAQGERTIALEGENLLIGADEAQPTVQIADQSYAVDTTDDCIDLHDVFVSYQLCEHAEFTADEDSLDAGTHDIEFHNPAPAGCPSVPADDGVTLTIADPPEVYEVRPTPICSEQLDYEEVEIDGAGFITLDGGDTLPEVTIGTQAYEPVSTGACELIEQAPAMDAMECSQLVVHVEADDLAGDVGDDEFITDVDVVVDNPEPVGCHSEDDTTIGVTPPPEITSVAPRAACNNDGTVTFEVDGEHLLEIDGKMTRIVVDDTEYDTDGIDCTDIDGEEDVRGCESLEVDIDAEQADLDGTYRMVAVNPEPAECSSGESEEFLAAGAPEISSADPDGFCLDANVEGELELFGTFNYDPADESGYAEPSVEIEGEAVDFEMAACSTALDDESNLQSCARIDTALPEDLDDDAEQIDVTVTDALACGATTYTLHRTQPPTVDDVSPRRVCSTGSEFTVTGTNLHENGQAFLDGEPADDVDVNDDGTEALVNFSDTLTTGTATFKYVNPGECESEDYEKEIRITDGPKPIFVDPRVVFDEMNTRVTIYAAGLYSDLGGEINDVELVHPDGETTPVEFQEGDRPSVIQADIPEGMLDEVDEEDYNEGEIAADFGIRLTDQQIECSNETDDLVTITGETDLALEGIEPGFGGTGEDTAVELFASDSTGDSEVQFEATPRAYLNPSDGDDDARGREIRALQFIDATELNGIVRSGLKVGAYDLIVVNPDGTVGVVEDAYTVTQRPAPRVESVSPAGWTNNHTALPVEIEGSNFRDNLDIDAFCFGDGDDITDEDQLEQPPLDNINVSEDGTLIDLTVETDGLAPSMTCYMRVTNDDGTYDEYSPITTMNPAAKGLAFEDGPQMNTARRAPTTLAGSPTRKDHYLYVIGGDDGSNDGDGPNAYSTGEFARLDRFGAPGQWNELPYDLPGGRTMADGVHIDDFVYLIGGDDGDGATDEIVRAQVLDPTDVPEITHVDIEVEDLLDDGDVDDGVDAGTYYYRVSAVYADDDPANPGGESLASEPQPIQLPIDVSEVEIHWEFPDQTNHEIDYFIVYRNVEADDPYGDEALIGTTSETSFVDDGIEPQDPEDQPMPQGALGRWHTVDDGGEPVSLNTPRSNAGITVAPHPTDDDQHFIYVVGGEDGDGEARNDYEIIDITVDGPRQQTVFESRDGQHLLPEAQTKHQTVTATGRNALELADEPPQIFTIGGTEANAIYSASVGTDGELGDGWRDTNQSTGTGADRYGHAGAAINGTLAALSGHNGDPSNQFHSGVIDCDAQCPPATTQNWDSLSDVGMAERVDMGDIAFRGFWYMTGGETSNDDASNTVEFSAAGATP